MRVVRLPNGECYYGKFICLLFTTLFVFITLQPLQAADKPEKIRIGYLSLVNGQLISKYLQLHEKEMGIPIEWFRFNSGRDVNTAMASNSLDFGNVGLPQPPSAWPAI